MKKFMGIFVAAALTAALAACAAAPEAGGLTSDPIEANPAAMEQSDRSNPAAPAQRTMPSEIIMIPGQELDTQPPFDWPRQAEFPVFEEGLLTHALFDGQFGVIGFDMAGIDDVRAYAEQLQREGGFIESRVHDDISYVWEGSNADWEVSVTWQNMRAANGFNDRMHTMEIHFNIVGAEQGHLTNRGHEDCDHENDICIADITNYEIYDPNWDGSDQLDGYWFRNEPPEEWPDWIDPDTVNPEWLDRDPDELF